MSLILLTILKISVNNMNQLLQLLNTNTVNLLLIQKENISHDFFSPYFSSISTCLHSQFHLLSLSMHMMMLLKLTQISTSVLSHVNKILE